MIFDKILKTQDQVLKLVNRNLEDKSSILLTYMNQHCYNIYSSNNMYRELIRSHFNVYIDGIGIYFTLKLLKFKNIERFNGTDLIDKIFQLYSERKTKLYLLGGAFSPKFIYKKCKGKKITLSGYHTGTKTMSICSKLIGCIADETCINSYWRTIYNIDSRKLKRV